MMAEQTPQTKTDQEKALSRANSVQPGTAAGTVPQSDPTPVPPPNADPKGETKA